MCVSACRRRLERYLKKWIVTPNYINLQPVSLPAAQAAPHPLLLLSQSIKHPIKIIVLAILHQKIFYWSYFECSFLPHLW